MILYKAISVEPVEATDRLNQLAKEGWVVVAMCATIKVTPIAHDMERTDIVYHYTLSKQTRML